MKLLSQKKLVYFLCFAILLCSVSLSTGCSNAKNDYSSIKWIGHSCFEITNTKGIKIITDPFPDYMGYTVPELKADIVTISHYDYDHSCTKSVKGKFTTYDKRDETKINDISIKGIKSYHDKNKTSENTIYTYNIDQVHVCHLGDIGMLPSEEDLKKIGEVDILMIPVGGIYTLETEDTIKVINELKPNVIIPMHYLTEASKKYSGLNMLHKVDDFTSKMSDCNISEADKFDFNKAEIDKTEKKIIILKYN